MTTRILIATGSCRHKLVQQTWLLLDLIWTGDQIRRVIISYPIVCNGENIQLNPGTVCLNDFPTLKDPDKINTVRLQCLHGINIQGHIFKLAFPPVLLDNFTHYRGLVGSAKTSINFAVKVAWPVQPGTGQGNQR